MSASHIRVSGPTLFLALVVLFSLFRYLHTVAVLLWEAPFIDFAHYYTYATAVRLGHNPFDPQAVAQVDALLSIRRAGTAANYPPLFYLLMEPWTVMAFRPAAVTWLFVSQACLFGALALCLRRFEPPQPIGVAAALFVAFNYQPLVENLALGQINAFLLLLVASPGGLRAEDGRGSPPDASHSAPSSSCNTCSCSQLSGGRGSAASLRGHCLFWLAGLCSAWWHSVRPITWSTSAILPRCPTTSAPGRPTSHPGLCCIDS